MPDPKQRPRTKLARFHSANQMCRTIGASGGTRSLMTLHQRRPVSVRQRRREMVLNSLCPGGSMMPKQRDSLEDVPDWARQALQGVTYWMGHRRCFYRNHPLTEGALVAEICNLVHANLP